MSETIIELKNLSAGYGTKTVLNDVNTVIKNGDVVGIVGSNGAGKSTLLKTVRGLLPHRRGEILFCGKPLETFSEKELACRIAYLQQHVEVGFGYTGKDIVLAGRYPYLRWWEKERTEDERIAENCMEYTGTLDLADVPVTEVSGGQKQRILLAKILAQQTSILFLDEPTTGLDVVYREEIFRFVKELATMGKTVLMVVHELDLAAKYCNRVLLLGEGKVLADAFPAEVFTEELLSRAYNTPIKVCHHPTGGLEITVKSEVGGDLKNAALLKKICSCKKQSV